MANQSGDGFFTLDSYILTNPCDVIEKYFRENAKRLDRIAIQRENFLSAPYYQTNPKFTALFQLFYTKKGRAAYSMLTQNTYIPTKAETFIGIPTSELEPDLRLLSTCGSILSVKQFEDKIKVYERAANGLGARFELKDDWTISKNEIFRMGKTNFLVTKFNDREIYIGYAKTKSEFMYSLLIVDDTIISKDWTEDSFMEVEHAYLFKKGGGWALRNLSNASQTWKFFKNSDTRKASKTYILQYEQMVHVGGNRLWVERLNTPAINE